MVKNAPRRSRRDVSQISRYIETARSWLGRHDLGNGDYRRSPVNASSTVLPSGNLFSTIYAGSHQDYGPNLDVPALDSGG